MPTTKAGQQAVNRYIAKSYDRINLTVIKGTKEVIQAAAVDKGKSINGYIKDAIQAQYEADTGEKIEL